MTSRPPRPRPDLRRPATLLARLGAILPLAPWLSAGLLAATLLVPTLSCGGTPVPEAEFVFANRAEVNTLDPNRMSWTQDIRIGRAIYEGLYTNDAVTLKPILGTAESVDVSDDKRTYTFTIRGDARWSNGDPVLADDYVFAWRRMLREPDNYTYLLSDYIRGGNDYMHAYEADPKSADFAAVGVERLGPQRLRLTLNSPTPFLPDLLAFPCYYPLNERSLKPFEQVDAKGHVSYNRAFTIPPALVCNGPYVLTAWDFKEGQTLTMNEFYWDRARTKSRTIRALDISQPLLAYYRYMDGQIDWVTSLEGSLAADLKAAGREDLKVYPAFGTYYWRFNCNPTLPGGKKNPFADVRVRQAFAMSVDKQPLVDNITRMGEPITTTFVPKPPDGPPYFPGYPHPAGLPYDVEAARKLMADAGYPGGRGFPPVSILYNTEGDHKKIAPVVAVQWQRALGVTVELEGLEIAQFKPRSREGQFEIARASWYGDYLDVSTFTDVYRSNSLQNDGGWVDPAYDALCDAAMKEPDEQKRLDLLSQAEARMLDGAAMIPMWVYVDYYLAHDDVRGLTTDPRSMYMLQAVSTPRSTGPGMGTSEAGSRKAEVATTAGP